MFGTLSRSILLLPNNYYAKQPSPFVHCTKIIIKSCKSKKFLSVALLTSIYTILPDCSRKKRKSRQKFDRANAFPLMILLTIAGLFAIIPFLDT